MSNYSQQLLMSQLTVGSLEVIKKSDGGAKRTTAKEGVGTMFYSFHPLPGLDEERIFGNEGSMMDDTARLGTSLSIRTATHRQSEMSARFVIVRDL